MWYFLQCVQSCRSVRKLSNSCNSFSTCFLGVFIFFLKCSIGLSEETEPHFTCLKKIRGIKKKKKKNCHDFTSHPCAVFDYISQNAARICHGCSLMPLVPHGENKPLMWDRDQSSQLITHTETLRLWSGTVLPAHSGCSSTFTFRPRRREMRLHAELSVLRGGLTPSEAAERKQSSPGTPGETPAPWFYLSFHHGTTWADTDRWCYLWLL